MTKYISSSFSKILILLTLGNANKVIISILYFNNVSLSALF